MSETIEVTQDRVIAELTMTADSSGVIKGGHVKWYDRIKDAEGNVIHAVLSDAEPIEGAIQPGSPFTGLIAQLDQQLLQTTLSQADVIAELQEQLAALQEAE